MPLVRHKMPPMPKPNALGICRYEAREHAEYLDFFCGCCYSRSYRSSLWKKYMFTIVAEPKFACPMSFCPEHFS